MGSAGRAHLEDLGAEECAIAGRRVSASVVPFWKARRRASGRGMAPEWRRLTGRASFDPFVRYAVLGGLCCAFSLDVLIA